MTIFLLIIKIFIASMLSVLAVLSIVFFIHFRWPSVTMWGLKVLASALSTVSILCGILSIIFGLATDTNFIVLLGVYVACIYFYHFIVVTRPPSINTGFDNAYSGNWANYIRPEQKDYFLSSRRVLKLPEVPDPRIEYDIPFAQVPGANCELLCDIWQPPATIRHSGLAYIYMHGGAFYVLDKNWATRSFFRHLAVQGHVIMDIAFRMAPEAGLADMIMDVKRALFWMKENAQSFGIDPDRIVLGGTSSGGFLALMAAYTGSVEFVPEELHGKDFSCLAVVAESPPSDLEALYYHTNQQDITRKKSKQVKEKDYQKIPLWLRKKFGKDFHRLRFDRGYKNIGAVSPLLGGSPTECPENYKIFSPATYIHSGCPPTLLIHGNHDIMAPVQSTRILFDQLTKSNVPVVMNIIAQADHSFNRLLPEISPAAINVVYDIERFIALIDNHKMM